MLATSYSQIDTFLQCPYRWYKSYLLGEREEETAEALSLGGAVHETLEVYFNKLHEGYEWTVGEAVEMIDSNIENADVPWLSEENKENSVNQHIDMMEGLASNTSNLAEFMADKEIVANEKEFIYKLHLPFDVCYDSIIYNDIYIIGSIDMIVKDSNGDLICIDFKTSKKEFKPKKLKENLQLPIYSLVIQDIYDRLPVETKYYFTRMDSFQDVIPIVEEEDTSKRIYFKTGKRAGELKWKQRTCDEIVSQLIDIFELQYATGMEAYNPNPTPLCSWCNYGFYNKHNCKYAMKFIRSDLDLPLRR